MTTHHFTVRFLTHFAPDCLLFFSYCATPDCPVAASNHMHHAGIPTYADRTRILAKLVASFLLLSIISSDVLCLTFGWVWQMLWIFKVARWTHNRRMKINKYPTASNGVRASSFEIWTEKCCSVAYPGHPNKRTELHLWRFKLEILLSWLPCGHPNKTWHAGFWFWIFLLLSFFRVNFF